MGMNNSVLTVSRLDMAFAGRRAVQDVSAKFQAGQVSVVLGPNGAGKSTLIKALAGLLRPLSGAVTLDGAAVAALDPRDRARRIGYLPQQSAVQWRLSVADIVALGRLPYRAPFAAPSARDGAAIADAMAQADVEELADRSIDTLSGGERARVLFARVLAGTPQWLIADEPLASLDPAHQLDLLERVRGLAASGVGVVMVLHDLAHAARVADHVLLMKNGRLIAQGGPREVMVPDRLAEAYGVAFELAETSSAIIPVALPRA
jgi:iron complex transport system ATP-binding protein